MQQAIACTLKINQSTVCTIISKYKKGDFIFGHKPGGGRKRITNCRVERTINRMVRKNMFSTLIAYRKCLSELNVNTSLTTLQRRMKDLEYVIRVPKRKPLLNIVQIKKRVQ